MLVSLQPFAQAEAGTTDLPGRVVAIWSKGAGKFVRSAGVDDGVPHADRDAYDAGKEGRFLCFAEKGGTFAIMDVMLERYLTRVGGQLTSAVTGAPATRRFTLIDQGNHYYAIQADNGLHVRVNSAGDLVVDAAAITDEAVFAIVPIRTGPDVVLRAFNGDDPFNQLPGVINELALFTQNPADFPVNKVNIGTLQLSPLLSSDQQLQDMRAVWNTKRSEDEAIIAFTDDAPHAERIDSLIGHIKRIESLGYEFTYVILYHEILANMPGGPWSDPRISSQEEIDLFRERVHLAYGRGELQHNYYKVFAMPYQFQQSLMGIPPFQNTPAGCDAAALDFIKQNFDGLFLEVNGHDYLSRDEHIDAALAAVWCQANGLEFGITSGGGTVKDTAYKTMYQDIFSEMAKVGFDKSWSGNHYILHHVEQPYENRLPEWVANTTTDNSRWLIENVMLPEAPSISPTLDTNGNGIPDLQEALLGTFPLEVAEPVVDDFTTYPAGSTYVNGLAGSPPGFAGTWAAAVPGPTVNNPPGMLIQSGNLGRSYRPLSLPMTLGMAYIRTNLALSTAPGSFQALEFSTTANNGDTNAVRLVGGSNLKVNVTGGGTGSGDILSNDAANHEWLIELNLATGAGRAWLDGNITAFDPAVGGVAFTVSPGFAINAVNIATFAAAGETPTVTLDDIRIGQSWGSIGVTVDSDTFLNWISSQDVGGQTALGDDPEGDRIRNGVENFFGTDPGAFSRGILAGTHDAGANVFTFTHPQGTLASDLSAAYQWSKDLATFHPEGTTAETTVAFSTSTVAGITTVTATVTGTIPNRFFVRVLVTQN